MSGLVMFPLKTSCSVKLDKARAVLVQSGRLNGQQEADSLVQLIHGEPRDMIAFDCAVGPLNLDNLKIGAPCMIGTLCVSS